ncbi:MAG: hypothetical protein ABR924_10715 [Terracidiphilus sp.]|jgi:hypothetical protein
MMQRTYRALLLLLCAAAFFGLACAQAQKTITVRMLDSRTGKLIVTTDFLVRVNNEQTIHADWITQNGDGTAKLTVPDDVTVISVRATYDNTMSFYVNCDANKDKGTAERGASLDHWYKVSDILALGVVAPNGCGGKKVPDKLQAIAKPGEFVFFVRKRNALEQSQE